MILSKIFVVEDEVIISKDIQRSLKKLGYEVVGSCVSGVVALEMLADAAADVGQNRPDLILMDINIKGELDGIETAARVREQFHIPVVYLTAFADAPTLERAKQTGPFGYLLKPFEERELGTAIEMGLYKHGAERALQQSQELLFATLNSIGDGVIVADPGERITFINPVACELTGWSRNEALGASVQRVLRLSGGSDTGALIENALRPADEPGAAIEALETMNALTLLRRNGLSVPIAAQFTPLRDEAAAVTGVVATFRDVTQTRALEERLVHQAFHDALTGLPNRALFVNRLRHTLSQAQARAQRGKGEGCLAVLFIDLDNFKWVNDSMGHQTGDYLLVEVSERLRRCLRGADTASRFGGDEFTILIDHIENPTYAMDIAGRIVASLGEPFQISGQTIYSSPSIGVAYSAAGQETPDELIRNADTAMYDAKRKGKARVAVFEPSLSEAARARMQLGNDLRLALARGEISLHYQPKVSLGDGTMHGVEALCRWNHPTRGQVPPLEFIALAEEIGMIIPLGRWVLREACVQARRWQKMTPDQPPFRMNVNLSAMQLDETNFVEEVQEILQETGLDAQYLTLEITESAVMNEIESKLAILKNLKKLGVRLAIDDFGTGYSSLSYLQMFPLDFLKIDRQFVRESGQGGDGVILNSMISLAHALNLSVVAEGAETASEVDQLRAMGCDIAQGYYFARPMPADQATAWMQETRATNAAREA